MKRRSGQTNHYARIEKYAAYIDSLFNDAVHKASLVASQIKPDPNKPFRLNDFPAIRTRIERISKLLFSQVEVAIKKASEAEWNYSNDENDKLVKSVFPDKQPDQYMNRNLDALSAFEKRKTDGMNLSDRVWKLDPVFKSELEMAIDVGLSDGRSAAELSRDIRQYLQNPDKLFRRVRDKNGVLQLSKTAKGYNPGRGVYRSSYKNAMRLARTEVNMAYHNADFERWQQLDFVVGIEIGLSNNHPVSDICDSLKGRYPKDFKFTGWHPQCRCHALSILASEKEFQEMNRKILAGEDYEPQSENEIKDVPDNFKKWIQENEQRVAGWKSKPYFMVDNADYLPKGMASDLFGDNSELAQRVYKALKQGNDTSVMYMISKDTYTAERQVLHNKIVDEVLAEGTTNTNTIYLLGGAPANGKSSILDSKFVKHPEGILSLDPDKLKQKLPEYKFLIDQKNMSAAAFTHEESSHIKRMIIDRLLKQNSDFVLDAVNDGEFEKLKNTLLRYKQSGKSIRADYVTKDTELSIKLAKQRALKTGRSVPIDFIRDMNKSISSVLPKIIDEKLIDNLYLWDTNINGKPRLILTQINGVTKIFDQTLYDDFLKKAL